jgi:predicted nucleotidyltransferase
MDDAASVLAPDNVSALRELASKFGVRNLRVFGSRARGQAGPGSDLDLLVDVDYGRGVAMRLVRFSREAQALLGVRVDLVTADGLDKVLHEGIFREARPL